MEQLNVYDFFGKEQDPLYTSISMIKKGFPLEVSGFKVRLNQYNIYEISNETIHECKATIDECYNFIDRYCRIELPE